MCVRGATPDCHPLPLPPPVSTRRENHEAAIIVSYGDHAGERGGGREEEEEEGESASGAGGGGAFIYSPLLRPALFMTKMHQPDATMPRGAASGRAADVYYVYR